MRILKRLLVLGLAVSALSLLPGDKTDTDMVNGVSFVGSRRAAAQEHVEPLLELGANYAVVMPFAFLQNLQSCELKYDSEGQWYGERLEGARQYTRLLHDNGIRVMLKPQIWVWRGSFTGEIEMETEEDWKAFEQSYRDYVLLFAQLAQEEEVEIYCIGTELERFVLNRSGFWVQLIEDIREVYQGKLTYAANWDEYPQVPFWSDLDFIGVDAYFPLSEKRNPSVQEIQAGWQRWKSELQRCSGAVDRPVLFTEFGYRSMDFGLKKPWLVDRNEMRVNLNLQANAYRAVFAEIWEEDWFSGGFLWKWFIEADAAGGAEDNRFTPQNKPAQEVITGHFQKYKHL